MRYRVFVTPYDTKIEEPYPRVFKSLRFAKMYAKMYNDAGMQTRLVDTWAKHPLVVTGQGDNRKEIGG